MANVLGTAAAARAARRVGASLTFVSSDYVFDGADGPYGEDDATHPINVYGAHKLEAEAAVAEAGPTNLVVRTCQVFGPDPRRANFVIRVADALRSERVVEVAGDLFGTPTPVADLARVVIELTLSRERGIWHVAGDTFLSRYELALLVADVFHGEPRLIVEVAADQMNDPVKRPRRAGLRNDRLAIAGLQPPGRLPRALAELAASELGL